MSRWEKQKKEERKGLIIAGIVLILLGICVAVMYADSWWMIAFIPIPGWVYGLGASAVGLYMLITGIRDK